ncbi:hypothetical protein [Escherichia coli]|uniref:hypothetical protein n=1 Tax=Escherichia coli TaxID=562 RepID=UPI000A86B049|nr:hypothetical protein [Escherichia coli]
MNISYVNSNKTTSLPVELDALNNKDISYAKDFFLYIETQLKIAKDFLDLEKKYQVLLEPRQPGGCKSGCGRI